MQREKRTVSISLSTINSLIETYLRNLREILNDQDDQVLLQIHGFYYDPKMQTTMARVDIEPVEVEKEVRLFEVN